MLLALGKLNHVAHRALEIYRNRGARYIIFVSLARLLNRQLAGSTPIVDASIVLDEIFTTYQGRDNQHISGDVVPTQRKEETLRIAWIVPLAGQGVGGMADIINLAAALSVRGHQNTLYVAPFGRERLDVAKYTLQMREFYGHFALGWSVLDKPYHLSNMISADVIIATSWPTAYIVNQLPGQHIRAYFVQDYEPWFYTRGSEALLADRTYSMDFTYITLGKWLRGMLAASYGQTAHVIDFPVDTSVFYPRSVQRSSKFRVAFYARAATARRSFGLGVAALLSFVQQAGSDVEVMLFGDAYMPYRTPFVNLGVLSQDELITLYSSIDVVLSLSATNMSLIPREAAACGAAIVELDLPPVRSHLTHGHDAYLAVPLPSAIRDALLHLYRDRALCTLIAQGGMNAVRSIPSWDGAALLVEKAFRAQASADPNPGSIGETIV